MSDVQNTGKTAAALRSNHPFFVFAKPYIDFIGEGKIFNIVYFVMAGIDCILPFVIGYEAIQQNVLHINSKITIAVIIVWLVIVFACWIGLQIWLDRRKKVVNTAPSEFSATMHFSHILQTFGEWLGTLTGIIGAGAGIIGLIAFGNDINQLLRFINIRFMRFGAMTVIIGPVVGFFIIIISRFIAEQLRLWAALANNTKHLRFLSLLVNMAKEAAANTKK